MTRKTFINASVEPAKRMNAGGVFMIAVSPTHGLGLFAARGLDSDFLLIKEPVVLIPKRELRGQRSKTAMYSFEWAPGWVALASTVSFMNHAKRPNCRAFLEDDDGKGIPRIEVYTLRQIQFGEELTLHYQDKPGKAFDDYYRGRTPPRKKP